MTAVSLSMTRETAGFGMKMSDPTVGTLAPNAGDVELRFQVLDGQSKNMNDLEIILILKAFIRYLQTGGGSTVIAITNQLLRVRRTEEPRVMRISAPWAGVHSSALFL